MSTKILAWLDETLPVEDRVTALLAAYARGRRDFRGAYLRGANLEDANLREANLSGVNLNGANLSGAYLYGANLSGANLYGANLEDANLRTANLSDANLRAANLSDAKLYRANLSGANLYHANLSGANLNRANLRGVNLNGAYHILSVGPVGSRGGILYAYVCNNSVQIQTGCFNGTLAEFKARVEAQANTTPEAQAAYRALFPMLDWFAETELKTEAQS